MNSYQDFACCGQTGSQLPRRNCAAEARYGDLDQKTGTELQFRVEGRFLADFTHHRFPSLADTSSKRSQDSESDSNAPSFRQNEAEAFYSSKQIQVPSFACTGEPGLSGVNHCPSSNTFTSLSVQPGLVPSRAGDDTRNPFASMDNDTEDTLSQKFREHNQSGKTFDWMRLKRKQPRLGEFGKLLKRFGGTQNHREVMNLPGLLVIHAISVLP